jgi:hypothetical protein
MAAKNSPGGIHPATSLLISALPEIGLPIVLIAEV